jgi:hypothetical protein
LIPYDVVWIFGTYGMPKQLGFEIEMDLIKAKDSEIKYETSHEHKFSLI